MIALTGLLVAAGCAPAPLEEERTGATAQAMWSCSFDPLDPDAVITTDATTGLDATVGRLLEDGHMPCSAVAITRNSAVTARHCFGAAPNPAAWSFNLPQGGGYTQPLTAIITHPQQFDVVDVGCNDGGIETAIADVAVVWFGPEPIPASIMAEPAYVGFPWEPSYFVVAGFGDTAPADDLEVFDGERRRGHVGGIELESDTSCLDGWGLQAEDCYDPNGVVTGDGDSGGGLFAVSASDPTVALLVGITSGGESDPLGDWSTWAPLAPPLPIHRIDYSSLYCTLDPNHPTCQSTSNAALVLQGYGEDADGDDIVDEYDNCPPWLCVNEGQQPEDCYNPDAADSDGDGRGDVCDACPFDSALLLAYDSDGDGFPDACDNCPHDDVWSYDADGDGVGDRCDCPGIDPTPYAPCNSQADCASAGHCIVSEHGNHCSRLPDGDGDGVFDACDGCVDNPNDGIYGIEADSNVDAEDLWWSGVAPVPDPCDEVAQMILRPNGLAWEDKDADCTVGTHAPEPCIGIVRFAAAAAVGSVDGQPKSFGPAPVGFRHCDCYDNGNVLDRDTCIHGQCKPLLGAYNFEGTPLSRYEAVTVATETTGSALDPTLPPGADNFPTPTSSPYLERTFESAIHEDHESHPGDGIPGSSWNDEVWRVGAPETITWRVQQDIDAGNVVGHPGLLGDETAGLFWSIVLPTFATASARDLSSEQRLRSTYAYLKTPVLQLDPGMAGYPDFGWACKLCSMVVSPESRLVNPFELGFHWPFAEAVRIVAFGEELAMSAGSDRPALDARPFLSPAVERLLLDGQSAWLAPVETGVEARRLRPGTHFVAVPKSWDAGARVFEVVEQGGLLQLAREIVGPDLPGVTLDSEAVSAAEPAVDPELGTALVPGPRSGARALLSLQARALFLVGGQTGSLPSSGEIWRYDLESRLWSRFFYDPPKIETVKALAYDSARQLLLVLDEVDEPLFSVGWTNGGTSGKVVICHDPPGKGSPLTIEIAEAALSAHLAHGDAVGACAGEGVRTVSRLVVVSLANGRAALLASWIHPRAGGLPLRRYERLALGAVGEGAFLLLGSRAELDQIDVFRVEFSPSGLAWTGTAAVAGRLLEEPARTADGLVAPVWTDLGERLVTFTAAGLPAWPIGPEGF